MHGDYFSEKLTAEFGSQIQELRVTYSAFSFYINMLAGLTLLLSNPQNIIFPYHI